MVRPGAGDRVAGDKQRAVVESDRAPPRARAGNEARGGCERAARPDAGGAWNGAPCHLYGTRAELFDPKTMTWATTGSLNNKREQALAQTLTIGKVLIAGGLDGSFSLNLAELYDPTTGKFTATGSMAIGRSYATESLLPNGRVLVTGGIGAFPGRRSSRR
jgi:hypothetical protein